MKNELSTLIIFLLVFLLACRNERSIKAKIFERKKTGENNLVIKYRYAVDGKFFTDSASLPNSVIEGDSINITIDPSAPQQSKYNSIK